MISSRRRWSTGTSLALATTLLLVVACGPKPSSVQYPGTILMTQRGTQLQEGGAIEGLYELRSGLQAPAPSSASHPAALAAALDVKAVSPDGRTVVLSPNLLKDLASGETYTLRAGEASEAEPGVSSPSFSTDGNHLAYTVFAAGLYVLNVDSKEVQLIRAVQCAEYEEIILPSGAGHTVCTGLTGATWLDPHTFFYKYFDGPLPPTFTPGEEDDPGNVNRMTVRTLEGEEILTMETPAGYLAPWSLSVQVGRRELWVEPGDLAQGTYEPEPLPESALGGNLSPDGRYVLLPGDPWRLLEWRTGRETVLGTRQKPDILLGCLWSPDQTYVACTGTFFPKEGLLIVPLSKEAGGVVFQWNAEEDWRLLAWTP